MTILKEQLSNEEFWCLGAEAKQKAVYREKEMDDTHQMRNFNEQMWKQKEQQLMEAN